MEEAPVALEEGGRKKCFFLVEEVAIPERQMEPDVKLNDTSDSDSMPILGRRSAKMKGMGGTQKNSSEKSIIKYGGLLKRYVMHDGSGKSKFGEALSPRY